MKKSGRRWWMMFSFGAVVLLLAVCWVTLVMLQLERRERAARADADHQESLKVDVDAIGQILFNLVDNACKYAADTDNRSIQLVAGVGDQQVIFSVRDHGPGVPAQFADSIFSAFERGGRDAGDAVPGVGLGLALSRGLARDLGGDLKLDRANCDEGTCFKLSIPLQR